MNMKHWKSKFGAIFLIGGDEQILSIELRKGKARFSEECDGAFWVEKPVGEAIEALQEAIDYLRGKSNKTDEMSVQNTTKMNNKIDRGWYEIENGWLKFSFQENVRLTHIARIRGKFEEPGNLGLLIELNSGKNVTWLESMCFGDGSVYDPRVLYADLIVSVPGLSASFRKDDHE